MGDGRRPPPFEGGIESDIQVCTWQLVQGLSHQPHG